MVWQSWSQSLMHLTREKDERGGKPIRVEHLTLRANIGEVVVHREQGVRGHVWEWLPTMEEAPLLTIPTKLIETSPVILRPVTLVWSRVWRWWG